MIEFLNPFLWGLLFTVIPVFIYLFRFLTKKSYVLPTITILEEDKKTRGLSLNVEVLKLVLRVLMIILIVLIFSQPFVSKREGNQIVFVIDNTFSARDNFNKYLNYIKEYISSVPDDKLIRIIDFDNNEIIGYKREIIDKLRYYYPKIGKFNESFFSKLKEFYASDIFVLTDGQKNVVDAIKKFNLNVNLVKFPYSLPNGMVNFSIWKRFGSEIEFKYEIICDEKSFVEIFAQRDENVIMLFSSEIVGRKVGEMKVSASVEGLYFLKAVLVNDFGTNEFIEPIYLGDVGFNLILDENFKQLETAFRVIGIKQSGGYNFVSKRFVNVDNIRNSIVIPYDENSKVIFKGVDILRKGGRINVGLKNVNISSLPISFLKNLYIPEGVEVYGIANKPVFLYDRVRNNVIVLGYLNLYSDELPWFIKEIVEFLLVDSKVKTLYPYGLDFVKFVDYQDGIFSLIKVPPEEIEKIEHIDGTSKFKETNIIPIVLFWILLFVMIVERVLSK